MYICQCTAPALQKIIVGYIIVNHTVTYSCLDSIAMTPFAHQCSNYYFCVSLPITLYFHVPFFSAYEMLSDPVKRRAFNSVDPTFDNSVPSKSEAKENFFQVFSPVFERNSR